MVVPPTDATAAAAAVAEFLRDDERSQRFARAGLNAVLKHYNWDRVAADTRKFTLDVTRGRKRR